MTQKEDDKAQAKQDAADAKADAAQAKIDAKAEADAPKPATETVPGGRYYDTDTKTFRDAEGNVIK